MKHLHIPMCIFLLLILITGCSNNSAQSPAILEIVDLDYRFSTSTLLDFSNKHAVDKSKIYQWQNHWVIFSNENEIVKIKTEIEAKFPRLVVKLYEKPFYNFNRQEATKELPAKEWTNVIMTANLVADTTLQHQYLEYHRTQFEKWPEVSKGFCKASFQQLLIFRNGRQLILVISIPKGKTLDELNPKTTENNPRVNDWNKIMAKYQEGIEDAPKGTTWVMFSSIKN